VGEKVLTNDFKDGTYSSLGLKGKPRKKGGSRVRVLAYRVL
jgi:hypothetical protein